MKLRLLTIVLIGLSASSALASPQNQVILPNGQNCALSATIDKSMRSLCHTRAQRKSEQGTDMAKAAGHAADVAPAAGDSTSISEDPHHKKKLKPAQ